MSMVLRSNTPGRQEPGAGRRSHPWLGVGLLVGLLLVPGLTLAENELVEGIVVRVNERIMTTRDFARRVKERAAETGKPVDASEYPSIIDEAVNDLCLLERAVELKIEVEDAEVESAVKGLREQNQVTDQAAFEQSLKSMGLSVEQLRARLRDTMVINRLLSREIGPLPVTDAELQQRYERDKEQFRIPEGVRLQHAVFSVGLDDEATERALEAAKRLVAAARSGQDFAKLVEEQVAAGVAQGGDLGVVHLPDLRKELYDALSTMKPGDISEPIRSSSGIHVFRLQERLPATYKPYAEVSGELRDRELSERYRSRMTGVVEGLKKRYVVELHREMVLKSQ